MPWIPGCPPPQTPPQATYSQTSASIVVSGDENTFKARRLNLNMKDVRRTIDETRIKGFNVVNQ